MILFKLLKNHIFQLLLYLFNVNGFNDNGFDGQGFDGYGFDGNGFDVNVKGYITYNITFAYINLIIIECIIVLTLTIANKVLSYAIVTHINGYLYFNFDH